MNKDELISIIFMIISMAILLIIASFIIGGMVERKQYYQKGYQDGLNYVNSYYEDFKEVNLGISGKNLTIYQNGKKFISVKDSKIDYLGLLVTCRFSEGSFMYIETKRPYEILFWNRTLTRNETEIGEKKQEEKK